MLKIKSLITKIILSCLVFILLTFSFVPYARAQGTWYNQSFEEWSTKVLDDGNPQEIFGERYTFAQVQWIIYSLGALLAGTDLLKCAGLASQEILEEFKSCVDALSPLSQDGSGTGVAFIEHALISTRPASLVEYFSEKTASLNIIPVAKAQGFGFTSLQPIQNIWRAFRNMAYLFMVIAILIMSFMIMFRVKISPQTVITIQSALPRLVMALILITFSYAIAGFLIDISYLIIGLIALFAKSGGIAANLPPPPEPINALVLAQRMWGSAATPIFSLVLAVSLPIILILLVGTTIFGGTTAVSFSIPVIGIPVAGATGFFTFFLVLLFIIYIVFVLFILLRVFWTALKALINVILLIIFGPIIILFGVVSPAAGGFGLWFKNLASNVAVFPTIAIMGFIAHVLYWSFPHIPMDILRRGSWVNPFEIAASGTGGEIAVPLFNTSGSLMGILAGLGILFLMPAAAELIKNTIAGKPFDYGTAMGQAVGLPLRTTGAVVGETAYTLGQGGQIAGIELRGTTRRTVGRISRVGEFMGIFPKHR